MEDDQRKTTSKDQDQEYQEDRNKDTEKNQEELPPRSRSPGTTPRQKPALRLVTKPVVGVVKSPDITTDIVVETGGTSRAIVATGGGGIGQSVEDNMFVKKQKMSITINGIDITKIQKKGGIKDNKKGAKKKTEVQKTPGRKRKQEPSSDQTGQMLRYVVKTAVDDSRMMNDRNQEAGQVLHKQEAKKTVVDDRNLADTSSDNKRMLNVNTNDVKTTFGSLGLQDIRGKIEKFQKFSSKSDNDCVLGSGRCAFHNCRLVRVLSKKKMSVVDDCGNISWDRRDVTSLACPKAAQTKPVAMCEDETGSQAESLGTNKKAKISRIFGGKISDQSTDRRADRAENGDT